MEATGILLATAKPNLQYVYQRNFKNVILEARINGRRVNFYETHIDDEDRIFKLKEETVFHLFEDGCLLKDKPFLKRENEKFYSVIHRDSHRNKAIFEKLVERAVQRRNRWNKRRRRRTT